MKDNTQRSNTLNIRRLTMPDTSVYKQSLFKVLRGLHSNVMPDQILPMAKPTLGPQDTYFRQNITVPTPPSLTTPLVPRCILLTEYQSADVAVCTCGSCWKPVDVISWVPFRNVRTLLLWSRSGFVHELVRSQIEPAAETTHVNLTPMQNVHSDVVEPETRQTSETVQIPYTRDVTSAENYDAVEGAAIASRDMSCGSLDADYGVVEVLMKNNNVVENKKVIFNTEEYYCNYFLGGLLAVYAQR